MERIVWFQWDRGDLQCTGGIFCILNNIVFDNWLETQSDIWSLQSSDGCTHKTTSYRPRDICCYWPSPFPSFWIWTKFLFLIRIYSIVHTYTYFQNSFDLKPNFKAKLLTLNKIFQEHFHSFVNIYFCMFLYVWCWYIKVFLGQVTLIYLLHDWINSK